MRRGHTAEEIFKYTINQRIRAEVLNEKGDMIFEGLLSDIQCNQFFISNENKSISMFRYEDLRYLYITEGEI